MENAGGQIHSKAKSVLEVLLISTRLGLTSFGGPIAHLGYFHNEYVKRKNWMDERSYADLVALCQFLPGPASSQVGIGIGLIRAGFMGGVAAWVGFTLPSVIALVSFAMLLQGFDVSNAGWIHGLKLVAVAIIAQAILGMGRKLAPDRNRATIALAAAAIALLWQTAFTQVAIIVAAGLLGLLLYRNQTVEAVPTMRVPIKRGAAIACLVAFFALLILLPLLRALSPLHVLAIVDSFYRAGALVFGGGHVVLPLLEQEVVQTGWLTAQDFLAGYGAAQAVPGPLFTFAAYVGAMMNGWFGALVATFAIFLPAFLLVIGALPFWDTLRRIPKIQGAMISMNAAVVGILLAAFYNPVWTSTIGEATDFTLAALLFVMLDFWKTPPWAVVLTGALGGTFLSLMI